MEIVTLGIDLAKNIFALHGAGADGKVVLQRPALINRVRGLLSELGIVLPQKADTTRRELAQLLEDLPGHCNTVVADAITDLERLDARVGEYDRHIATCAKTNADARRLMQLSGIGPTTASALVASIGDGHDFASGRQFAAWLGMVPGQYSSGGKQRLGRITKAGDRYLRTLLIANLTLDLRREALVVEVTGAARLYRAASVWTAGLGLVHQHTRREAAESCAGTECDALKPPT